MLLIAQKEVATTNKRNKKGASTLVYSENRTNKKEKAAFFSFIKQKELKDDY